jgi:hypothetical protein
MLLCHTVRLSTASFGTQPERRRHRHHFGHLDLIQQGTLTVLYRQTWFGTFGGGDAASCNILAHICCTSGAPNRDKSTGDGSGGKSGPPGSTSAPGGTTVPGGNGGSGIPPGSNTVPAGKLTPGGSGSPGDGGGAGTSVAWSTRRTDPDAAVVSPLPSGAVASKTASIAMAAAPAQITGITRRR